MTPSPLLRSCFAFLLAVSTSLALAQAQKAPAASAYEPTHGQEGKDVVWIPTAQLVVDRMLDLAKVTPRDVVYDLGSGDGRTVITAAKRGARGFGVEYNPDMVELSRRNAEKEGVSARATFVKQDLFETDLSQATVITMFLLPEINLKLRPKILALKPGTRVVSNTFTMGDWEADERADLSSRCDSSWCTALYWVVPARVEGKYTTPHGEIQLRQRFQMLSGSLSKDGRVTALQGKVNGEEIRFTTGGRTYIGRLNGKVLELK